MACLHGHAFYGYLTDTENAGHLTQFCGWPAFCYDNCFRPKQMTAMEMYLLASLFIAFCQFLYNFFAGINTFNQTGNIKRNRLLRKPLRRPNDGTHEIFLLAVREGIPQLSDRIIWRSRRRTVSWNPGRTDSSAEYPTFNAWTALWHSAAYSCNQTFIVNFK